MTVPPLSSEPPDWDAIARYRAGESVGDEARRIGAWLEANPADAEMLAALDDAIAGQVAPGNSAPIDVDAALRSVRARLHEQSAPGVIPFPVDRLAGRSRRARGRWIGAGAAIAAAAALVVMLTRPNTSNAPIAVAPGAPGSVFQTSTLLFGVIFATCCAI